MRTANVAICPSPEDSGLLGRRSIPIDAPIGAGYSLELGGFVPNIESDTALCRSCVDYEAGTVGLEERTFLLARGRAGQLSIIDVARSRIVASAVVGEDGTVISSNDVAEQVIEAWLVYCSTNGREPWPRAGGSRGR